MSLTSCLRLVKSINPCHYVMNCKTQEFVDHKNISSVYNSERNPFLEDSQLIFGTNTATCSLKTFIPMKSEQNVSMTYVTSDIFMLKELLTCECFHKNSSENIFRLIAIHDMCDYFDCDGCLIDKNLPTSPVTCHFDNKELFVYNFSKDENNETTENDHANFTC